MEFSISASEKDICLYCSKKIRPFSVHYDWKTRKYHKSCYKKKTLDFCYELMLDEMRVKKSLE